RCDDAAFDCFRRPGRGRGVQRRRRLLVRKLARQILLSLARRQLQDVNPKSFRHLLRWLLEARGYLVVRANDYYSPLISASRLRSSFERWNRPSTLHGIAYDIEEMKSTFADLLTRYLEEFCLIPSYATLQAAGFGPGYTAVDALTLYMMVREL